MHVSARLLYMAAYLDITTFELLVHGARYSDPHTTRRKQYALNEPLRISAKDSCSPFRALDKNVASFK